jgi:spore coat polysaccharide biosynthesis predicted glycosyltransferase SpsG
MPAAAAPVVFRAAAGPRIGYGHLVRMTVLGRAMGVTPLVSVRGTTEAARVARRLKCRVARGGAAAVLRQAHPSLLVIDDPSANRARPWVRAAARRGVPVATVHDLGLAACDSDLAVDGSVVQPGAAWRSPSLVGPRYLILDTETATWRDPCTPSVLIALGGGPRRRTALALARAIRAARPDVTVYVAGGLAASAPGRIPAGITWLGPRHGLGADLCRASLAILGGGVSLYEACRTGTPAVGVAVVPAQRPTISGLAARGAVIDGGSVADLAEVTRRALSLLEDARLRSRLSRVGRALVDGRGADRVAQRLRRLAQGTKPAGHPVLAGSAGRQRKGGAR